MKAHFEDGKDIAKLDVLLDIGRDLELDPEEISTLLEEGHGLEAVNKDMEVAKNMGISGVPFFIIDGKYALSGAYPSAQFLEAFRKIAQE
jgi:predicted DsbA family dithiol-disulfide isomerase